MKTTGTNTEQVDDTKLTAEQVHDYLRKNPDFFLGRENLLVSLELPHQRGHSISLVEKQLSVLREKNTHLRHELDQLLNTATRNDLLFGLCRQLTLALLDASSIDDFFTVIEKSLANDFKCDAVRLILATGQPAIEHPVVINVPVDTLRAGVPGMANSRKPVLGVVRGEERDFLFPGTDCVVQSAAVIPLWNGKLLGLLAVGSTDANHFGASLDTLFLDFIALVIIKLLPRLM